MERRRSSVRAARSLLFGALLTHNTFAQTAPFGTGVFNFGNSSSSCNNCNVTVPPFFEYYWSPTAYATTTSIAVPAAVNITYYHGSSSLVSLSTLPLGNYSTLLPVTTTKHSTITRTYGPDNTFTTVITYPTPFIDYDTAYSLSGTLSTSSDCLSHTTQVTFTPSSHPLYPQLTDVPTSSGDQYGSGHVLVSTQLPQTLPGTHTTEITNSVVFAGSRIVTASDGDLHLSITASTSAFYRSAFSDQAAIGECRPPSSGPTLTEVSFATAAPLTHTSVEFLTTSKSSSLDAGAFAALVSRVAAAEGSSSQQVSQQGGGSPPPAAQPQSQPQAQPESEGGQPNNQTPEGNGSPNGVQNTAQPGSGAPGVNTPSGNQAATTAVNGAPTPGSEFGDNQPARPASGNDQGSPANTASPESPAPANAQGNEGSAGPQNTSPAASGAGSNSGAESPAAGQGTVPQETGAAASRVSEASAGNGNTPESAGAAPFAITPTSVVATLPVTGPSGVEPASPTTVPAVIISGQTLTFGGTVSGGGTAFHLTTFSSGGEAATAVIFGTSGEGQSSTFVITPGSSEGPVTTSGGGGIGTFICSGVGGCAGQGTTRTGTATTPVSPEFTGAAVSKIGPKRIEVVLIVALLVIVPALGAG